MGRTQEAARVELMFQTLAVLAVCLSTFNMYLLGWLWWGAAGGPWTQIELLSQWRQLKFKGIVVSSGLLRLAQVSGRPEPFGASEDAEESSQANTLRINATRFQLQPLEITTNNSKQPAASSTSHRRPILLSIKDGQMNFTSGLLVEGAFQCEPFTHLSTCVIEAPNLRLSQPQSLDMSHKSLQLTKLRARRLHAPIGQLKLLGSTRLHFRSAGQLRVEALERLSLRGKNVILNSTYVDVSNLRRVGGQRGATYYKLCVCLPASWTHQQPAVSQERIQSPEVAATQSTSKLAHKKSGLLFAVRGPGLACGDFSAVCMAGPT